MTTFDVFNVTSRETYGDTETITSATVFGGDDAIIFTGDTGDFPSTRIFVFSEGDIVTSSSVFGGKDTIDVSLVTLTSL